MKYGKTITVRRLFSLLLGLTFLASITVFHVNALETVSVRASTSETVTQGGSTSCTVAIDAIEGLSSLQLAVHYDPAKVKITSVYNSIGCALYDSFVGEDALHYSYIFNDDGQTGKKQLFYFYYQVLETAEPGKSYFDVIIEEAYDHTLAVAPVGGSRTAFTVTERKVIETCSVYGQSSVNASVKETFSLQYSLDRWDIASGSMALHYDPELFSFEGLTLDRGLEGVMVDVNAALAGTVYISFVGTERMQNNSLFTVSFQTLKNTADTAEMKLTVSELYTEAFESVSCAGCTTKVYLSFDPSYTEDAPSMILTPSVADGKLTAVITMEKNTHLGAGDFVVRFDPALLSYSGIEKGFSPSFFHVNDKNAANGEIKFSLISMTDIVTAETVMTLQFDIVPSCAERTAVFVLEGTGLADSMTAPILLNFISSDIALSSGDHRWDEGVLTKEPTKNETGMRTYSCMICQAIREEIVEKNSIYDVNTDGVLNILDVSTLLDLLAYTSDLTDTDINSDGMADIRDVSELLDYLSRV